MTFSNITSISPLALYSVPEEHGVYVLYEGQELIYIGRAAGVGVTLKSRLTSHNGGYEGPCTQRATSFCYEACHNSPAREVELLEWYKGKFGRLPRCNERIG